MVNWRQLSPVEKNGTATKSRGQLQNAKLTSREDGFKSLRSASSVGRTAFRRGDAVALSRASAKGSAQAKLEQAKTRHWSKSRSGPRALEAHWSMRSRISEGPANRVRGDSLSQWYKRARENELNVTFRDLREWLKEDFNGSLLDVEFRSKKFSSTCCWNRR